jgi:RNA-directed DNA polymerase
MTRRKDQTPTTVQRPATVPFAATPVGQPHTVKEWAHRSVWTERMLRTLEQGVRGGRWHTLIDKVYLPENLLSSHDQVQSNAGAAGVDHQTVEDFDKQHTEELRRLTEALRTDSYRPQAVLRVWIPKPGSDEKRPLGIPTVRDRVVQTALLHTLEPIFDSTFADHSYGFRHGRGCQQALEQVEKYLEEGKVYIVDADLKSYFDTIPHDRLMACLKEKVSDSRILRLIEMFLQQGIMDGLSQWTPDQGSPQGAVISPLLANIYLNPLDHQMAAAGFAMIRYADDFVLLCPSREEAERALDLVRRWVEDNGLTLHPTKTKIVDARTEGFDFLGYHFRGRLRLVRKKSLDKLKDTIRTKTQRNNGRSLEMFVIPDLNRHLRGWFAYFRHCHWNVYTDLDSWVRGRLRSILRKRQGRSGRGRGADHQRWPNAFFTARKLYSLSAAHHRFAQSAMR